MYALVEEIRVIQNSQYSPTIPEMRVMPGLGVLDTPEYFDGAYLPSTPYHYNLVEVIYKLP